MSPPVVTSLVSPTVLLWLTSFALFVLGLIAHHRITTADQTAGLETIRYTGILCGSAGVVGVPLAAVLNPITPTGSPLTQVGMVVITVLIAAVVSHYSWPRLGPGQNNPR